MNAIIDNRASAQTVDALKNLGYNIIKTPKLDYVQEGISCHPDIMTGLLNFSQIVVEPNVYDYFKEKLPKIEVIKGKTILSEKYPDDIAYNAVFIGNCLFCNKKYTDSAILNYANKNGIKILNTRQGYTKCSICAVSNDAIITSDKNIQFLATENNIDVLYVENKTIKLNGYEYGFIGGATGTDKNKIFFNGNLKTHPQCNQIKSFCQKYGKTAISLNNKIIEDIGSIIFIE